MLSVETRATERTRLVDELGKIAFSDIGKVVTWGPEVTVIPATENGEAVKTIVSRVTVVDSAEIDDDTRAAVAEVSQDANGASLSKTRPFHANGKPLSYRTKDHADPGGDDPIMFLVVLDDDGGKPSPHMHAGPQVVRISQITRIEDRSPAYAPRTNRVDDGAVLRARVLAVEADE